MAALLIDTNVPIAANGGPDFSPRCVLEAIDCLENVQNHGVLLLDDQYRVLGEYERHLNSNGQPNPGDYFYNWALRQKNDPALCQQLPLDEPADKVFASFPHHDPALDQFDASDRKFVALCLAHGEFPPIYVAGDRGWPKHAAALAAHGVPVAMLCQGGKSYANK